jgi:hypothetical protein
LEIPCCPFRQSKLNTCFAFACPAAIRLYASIAFSKGTIIASAPQDVDIVPFVLKSDRLHSENLKIRIRGLEATFVFSVRDESTSRANIKVPSNILVIAAI